MAGFLYTLLGITVGTTLNCVQREQISPCTCTYTLNSGGSQEQTAASIASTAQKIDIACEKMTSFNQVVDALRGNFNNYTRLNLRISHSSLDDLAHVNGTYFKDLGISIRTLNMSLNNISGFHPDAFEYMDSVAYLNLANNLLTTVPTDSLLHMPRLKTLSLGGNKIQELRETDFKGVNDLYSVVVSDNEIYRVDQNAFPANLRRLAIARNNLTTFNDSLKNLHKLEWVFASYNDISDLEGELPVPSRLWNLNLTHNLLTTIPDDFYHQSSLEHLELHHNKIYNLGGNLKKFRKIDYLDLSHNKLTSLDDDDFLECEKLEQLFLDNNMIIDIKNALLPLKRIIRIHLQYNSLTKFSLSQVKGLSTLRELDLKNNRIERLISSSEENYTLGHLKELNLAHNEILTLDGFLHGLTNLSKLNLSHNQLCHLSLSELVGLDKLALLDISHNQISTLSATSLITLPLVGTLLAGHNQLTILDKELHSFPNICYADFSHNKIVKLGGELASRSTCRGKDNVVVSIVRIFLKGNELQCSKELANAKESNKGFQAELIGLPECEMFENSPSSSSPMSPPTASITEILEVKKLDEVSADRTRKMEDEPVYQSDDPGQEPVMQILISSSPPTA
ncbi:insulin-like growth factor-binding protein complex acid labile subunit [Cloeon dipterum]|uniref:insulin-like growth factor-binding protein complex acid labile subunit n=1 Tax=Cloeon dipterum TaxID=197152 RepID=UPI0032203862